MMQVFDKVGGELALVAKTAIDKLLRNHPILQQARVV
jgi:hypothetical protein